jgi:hypothetical protein
VCLVEIIDRWMHASRFSGLISSSPSSSKSTRHAPPTLGGCFGCVVFGLQLSHQPISQGLLGIDPRGEIEHHGDGQRCILSGASNRVTASSGASSFCPRRLTKD